MQESGMYFLIFMNTLLFSLRMILTFKYANISL